MAELRLSVYLLVFACISWLDGGLTDGSKCKPDEYYDGVVDNCTHCKLICEPCNEAKSEQKKLRFCHTNCPGYYSRKCPSTVTSAPSTDIPPLDSSPLIASTGGIRVGSSNMTTPLLWISLSCLLVAMMAVLVVVLFFICYYMRSVGRASQVDVPLLGSGGYSRSTSQLSSASGCQDKKCLHMHTEMAERTNAPDIQQMSVHGIPNV